MNNQQRKKLYNRLFVTILSLLTCVAVMAVGVYAAQQSFDVQVTNQVNIDILHVDGNLYAMRFGDVVYGTTSVKDDSKLTRTDSEGVARSANMTEFVQLYGRTSNDTTYSADPFFWNKQEIMQSVNFYTEQKESLTIYYVFRFEFSKTSQTNVIINLANNSTQLTDDRKDNVTMRFKYQFASAQIAGWSTNNIETSMANATSFGIDGGGTATIKVEQAKTNTHFVYIYAALTVERTNTLADSYTLGIDENDEFVWSFDLDFDPEYIQN